MENSKPWYASKTIWSSILIAIVSLGQATGIINEALSNVLTEKVPDILASVSVTVLALFAAYGRKSAEKKIN